MRVCRLSPGVASGIKQIPEQRWEEPLLLPLFFANRMSSIQEVFSPAMNELSEKQKSELLQDLISLEASLADLLDLTQSKTKPVSLRENIGRLSRMDEMHNQSILIANRTVTSNRLKRVKIALALAAEGNYGLCEECGTTIAFERLKAYPDASMCITCKGLAEQD